MTNDYYVGHTLVCLMCASPFTLQPEGGWADFPSSALRPGPWNPSQTVQEAVIQIRAALAKEVRDE